MDTTLPVRSRTANERLKDSFWSYVWAATAISALVHFTLLRATVFDGVPDYSYGGGELEQIELEELAKYEIPPPPEKIARPAVPVLSTDVNISADLTIGEIEFDQVPVALPPAPPAAGPVEHSDQPAFTPYEIRPSLLNPDQLQEALLQRYPVTYKQAGIGGVATLWIYVDETGDVLKTRVVASSGYAELDEVAEQVLAEVARFSPAYNRDMKVPVWIQIPVTFATRKGNFAG